MKRSIFFLILVLLLSACLGLFPNGEKGMAEKTVNDFFSFLSQGRYDEADRLYGGDYETLRSFNPAADLNDHAALWEAGCQLSGLQCLPVRRVISVEKISLKEFILVVEFQNKDDSPFILEPCCGASEDEMPPTSEFEVFVIEREGKYYVTSLPVFVP